MRALDFEPLITRVRSFLTGGERAPLAADRAGMVAPRSRAPGAPPDLYGPADAAYALWITGELESRTTPGGREAWAAGIQRLQNPESGWFDAGILAGHGPPHATAFATGALVLLGARPVQPLRFAEALFATTETIEAWLDGFAWRQIWTGSHAAGAAAALLDAPDGVALPDAWPERVLDALTRRVDPATGLWKRALHDRLLRRPTAIDLGGAAHFWWLYERIGRPVPRPEGVVDGILGLQRRSGLWGNRWLGGAFPHGLDFDALHGLRVAWSDCSDAFRASREAPLRGALERYARVAHAHLMAPGCLEHRIRTPHKLVGTLNALAELDRLWGVLTGARCVDTERPLRSALTRVCWQ